MLHLDGGGVSLVDSNEEDGAENDGDGCRNDVAQVERSQGINTSQGAKHNVDNGYYPVIVKRKQHLFENCYALYRINLALMPFLSHPHKSNKTSTSSWSPNFQVVSNATQYAKLQSV